MKRTWALLRSRRVAVWLLLAFVSYSIIATLRDDRDWSRPYASPLFLTLAGWLAISTAACAWERTQRAFRLGRIARSANHSALERLASNPQVRVELGDSASASEVTEKIVTLLRNEGLKTEVDGTLVHAWSGVWTLWGSPVFHWSLAGLMIVAALGQLTRSEGFLALPVGERILDVHSNYPQVVDGVWFGEKHTGLTFELLEFDRAYQTDGVDWGPTPLVGVYRDGVELKRVWVHPNNPLRVGALMMHNVDYGPAVVVGLEEQGGGEIERATVTLDRSEDTSSGSKPKEFVLEGPSPADTVVVRVQAMVTRTRVFDPAMIGRAVVETAPAGSDTFGRPMIVVEGNAADLPGGYRLRIIEVKDWVRVAAVNDWSVTVIYALLGMIIAALGVAVLGSARRARVLLVNGEQGFSLHAAVWDSRRDSGFRERLASALARVAEWEAE